MDLKYHLVWLMYLENRHNRDISINKGVLKIFNSFHFPNLIKWPLSWNGFLVEPIKFRPHLQTASL